MTAIIIATQRNRGLVHVAVDAAVYDRDHVITAFGTKVFTVPHWPGLVTSAGNCGATILLGTALSQEFATFDELVENSDDRLPGLVAGCGLPTGADVFLAGISEKRGPESYAFRTDDSVPSSATSEAADAFWNGNVCRLVRLADNDIAMMPIPIDQFVPASFNFDDVKLDADPELIIWTVQKLLEMMRQSEVTREIGAIGGCASVTTISAQGISQRMLQRWSEDRIGAPLRPAPVDWERWHRDNPRPTSTRGRKADRFRVVK